MHVVRDTEMFFILEKKTHNFQSVICGVCMFGGECVCASQGSWNDDQDIKLYKLHIPLYIYEISKESVPNQKKMNVKICVLKQTEIKGWADFLLGEGSRGEQDFKCNPVLIALQWCRIAVTGFTTGKLRFLMV